MDASGVAVFSVDGVARLTRNRFVSNDTIVFGDPTNDANVDGVMRIQSFDKLCLLGGSVWQPRTPFLWV